MTDDLSLLLSRAADDLVPEHDPFSDRVDGVARLVRRRRRVRSVQAGAGAVVGVAVIGSAANLATTPTTLIGTASSMCGEPAYDVLPASGPFDTVATVQARDGMSIDLVIELANPGDESASSDPGVELIVSLQGTGEVVGYADTTVPQVEVAGGEASEVVATATLLACDRAGFAAAGDPLPDGVYDLAAIGTMTSPDGGEQPWPAFTGGIEVEGGRVTAWDTTTVDPDAAFAPECGAMIPAVPENPMWASLAAVGSGPFGPADPDEPYTGGLALDVTIGTTSTEPVSGELGAEIVTVLTDLDGRVITWWRASDHGRPLDLGAALELEPQGEQVMEGFGWFPVSDSCAGDAPIGDGDYRLFGWVAVVVDGGSIEYPMVTAPLDVRVSGGTLTVG